MTASNALGAQSAQDQQVTPAVRAQMADPAAWAVTAFATTSFMLGMYQTGILNAAGTPIVLPAAFFFGGLVQIIVAVLEISKATCSGGRVRHLRAVLGDIRSVRDLVRHQHPSRPAQLGAQPVPGPAVNRRGRHDE